MIVGLAVIAFLALICAYLYALLVTEPSSGGRADSLNNIERVMFTMWERLVPIGQQVHRS
jgi:hypothetical protein